MRFADKVVNKTPSFSTKHRRDPLKCVFGPSSIIYVTSDLLSCRFPAVSDLISCITCANSDVVSCITLPLFVSNSDSYSCNIFHPSCKFPTYLRANRLHLSIFVRLISVKSRIYFCKAPFILSDTTTFCGTLGFFRAGLVFWRQTGAVRHFPAKTHVRLVHALLPFARSNLGLPRFSARCQVGTMHVPNFFARLRVELPFFPARRNIRFPSHVSPVH